MRERCWSCKKWEEHFYWDHLEESNLHFMKVMDGDFTLKMEFPQKFVKNFRVELIDVVALEAPSGILWEIGLCKEQDRLYFNGGWKKFIEANGIEKGYILVFDYAGDSMFQVRIFDSTGCVKAASNQINNPRAKQKMVDQTWQNFQRTHSSKVACNDYPMLHEQTTDSGSASGIRFIEEEHGMDKFKDDGRLGSSKICKKEYSEVQPYSTSETKLSLRNSKDIVNILEQKFASKRGNWSFVKLITRSNITSDPFMAIPIKFVSIHFPRKPFGITVCNQSKKKWYVNCSWRSSSWGFQGKSMAKLVHENKIQKGDACVFELMEKSSNVVMQMRIVGAMEILSILKKYWF
ncbi:hypothetical protein KFK09_015783 [Dendrobium nobile]|uniref:TF-B3 domain-containing protein n=1 Tax=Dendrobium nobile TaxID=94219 RepID=A0A8T3B5S1_DENNO|nr:hypothetical protein KFK09_015783 [Dendrobium nobile]